MKKNFQEQEKTSKPSIDRKKNGKNVGTGLEGVAQKELLYYPHWKLQ